MTRKLRRKEITYCIDGTNLVNDVWLEQNATDELKERGWIDFLKWLAKVQKAPTHTEKYFRVVFEGSGDVKGTLKQIKVKNLKPKDFQVAFAGKVKTEKVLLNDVRTLKAKEKTVVLVSTESNIHRAARTEGVRCITPQDFLMVFQAVI